MNLNRTSSIAHMNAKQRTALYVLAGSIITAISAWGLISEAQANAIITIVNGVLGMLMSFVAVKNITPDEVEDGGDGDA